MLSLTLTNFVKECFSLDKKSFNRFNESIKNVKIDNTLKGFLNEENDYRFKIDLNIRAKESLDISWEFFQIIFKNLIKKYDIAYKDYALNKKNFNKNNYKIIKLIKTNYSSLSQKKELFNKIHYMQGEFFAKIYDKIDMIYDDDSDEFYSIFFDKTIEYLNELRTTKTSKTQLVISKNYKDFFLSATDESWRTCLSVESPSFTSYWAGLPGTVVDKNLYMLYITSGDTKNYEGIIIDKIISRSWALLDTESCLNLINFYPNNKLNIEKINKELPFKVKRIGYDFESKYRVIPLQFKNGYSCYIYQDKTKPFDIREDGSFKMKFGTKGMYFIHNNRIFEGPIFHYQEGLRSLYENESEILDYFKQPKVCSNCGVELSFSREKHELNSGHILCTNCIKNEKIYNYFKNDIIDEDEDEDEDGLIKNDFYRLAAQIARKQEIALKRTIEA